MTFPASETIVPSLWFQTIENSAVPDDTWSLAKGRGNCLLSGFVVSLRSRAAPIQIKDARTPRITRHKNTTNNLRISMDVYYRFNRYAQSILMQRSRGSTQLAVREGAPSSSICVVRTLTWLEPLIPTGSGITRMTLSIWRAISKQQCDLWRDVYSHERPWRRMTRFATCTQTTHLHVLGLLSNFPWRRCRIRNRSFPAQPQCRRTFVQGRCRQARSGVGAYE
ncbi:hypothetical protein FHT86_001622 [Rhizobium sp. BK313]|nr:hypothetical protein [Rhizobium sp. BK313]